MRDQAKRTRVPRQRTPSHDRAVVAAQNANHAEDHDYDKGSPHLRHRSLRSMVEQRLTRMVRERIDARGSCRVLEVGAGHGTFTSCLLAAGAEITVTEASSASAEHLRRTFGETGHIEVMFDESGEEVLASGREWDLAVITSVLHHIPDYVTFLDRLCGLLAAGGGIFTVQDPLYYPRMSKLTHRVERAAYLSWRIFQGDYGRGVRTRLRRLRGVYDDNEPSDLVEYHVVRDGVDEDAISELLEPRFASFELFRYWSSQAPLWQRVGERVGLETTFGLEATGYLKERRLK
jgi:2-polyprenyl-3-methyl-5-hydroxy-6-metoxy-1,4-benzoquinol methylase